MKSLLFTFSIVLFISCSSDDNDPTIVDHSSSIFTSYIETYDRPEIDGIESFKKIKTGEIIDGKFHDYQLKTYFDNELKSEDEFQQYVYSNNKLISIYPMRESDEATKQDLFYDENNNFTGFYWEKVNRYYQIVHKENNIDYFQILTGNFDDENSSIHQRYILKFDDHNNVIKAGLDIDLDEVMDFENKFSYDENDNLISIEMSNGESTNITYSEIKNTKAHILDNSYGKRIRRLKCSEILGSPSATIEEIKKLEFSTHLSTYEVDASLELDTSENNFYTKRTIETDNENQSTETIEFITQ
ncbi:MULTISPECIES: hypothetical protein [Mesonia]|uniref:Uncharacterized protein n=1 Tax=Mesonia oceanica TaxID=2687242 RepID=A0AC61YBS8_9FLAO|nr:MULTISPECIES: hypothetical protein [Mesonia]MAN29087.1 hypothetical protein [Mesonia sp.]MAQ41811.1 hypothetical protein [Mesonia sp.]MBJ98321.1 hypothetical protein [Flavobacteriaceae bacterium]VVV01755.1 hypothetical protein FVB9532_03049 [Mesonia oceanica]|tara:strand:- start:40553 stop:41455 length:903 start_codon:yes stop_codon:yes gene_type:complete